MLQRITNVAGYVAAAAKIGLRRVRRYFMLALTVSGPFLVFAFVVKGVSDLSDQQRNAASGAEWLLGAGGLLAVLIWLVIYPLIRRGRLPSGRTLDEWQARRRRGRHSH